RPELGVGLLDLVHALDQFRQVLVGLLGEDQDDGRTLLRVVLADVAEGVALLLAADRLHLEGPADLAVRAGLQLVGPQGGQRQGQTECQNRQGTEHAHVTLPRETAAGTVLAAGLSPSLGKATGIVTRQTHEPSELFDPTGETRPPYRVVRCGK